MGKQRIVLAALLLHVNQVVQLNYLIEALWGSNPPQSSRVTVQNYVKRLRKAFGRTGRDRISTQAQGYVLCAGPDEVDAPRFTRLVREARTLAATESWEAAAASADSALILWQGQPLTGISSDLLKDREVPRLTEKRLQVLEIRMDANLRLGRESEMIDELLHFTEAYPLREKMHGLLMLALYRCGRQGEALSAYQKIRQSLAGELGIDPSAELRNLHERILAADAELLPDRRRPPVSSAAAPPPRSVPRELPAALRNFTGRDTELSALTALVDHAAGSAPRAAVISAISGMAGVGKTALAIQWAHQVADRFPDGQLYVNLRGYDPAQPIPPEDALADFLRALDVTEQDIPSGVDARAARYRSLVATRRMLVVLDNARSEEQVRPLLSGTPGCVTVITSRNALSGLVARDGAVRLGLDPLPLSEAVGLFRDLIGDRADSSPLAVEALAVRCGRLPLALRVLAEFAASHPALALADLNADLAIEGRRLNLLDSVGDERTAVRTVFSWSYKHLDADTARTFRLASLHPGPELDARSLAALKATTAEHAERALTALVQAHLLRQGRPGRYVMHDLLRAYARELADHHDGEHGQRATE